MEPVDTVVEHWPDALPVERRRVAGVLAPGGRARIGVMGNGQCGASESTRAREVLEPADRRGDGRARSAEEERALSSRKVDEGVRLGQGRRERLLAEARYTRFEDRTIDRAMERRGREVEYSVEQLIAEQLSGVSIGSRARRPGFDGSCDGLGGARTRVGECGDRYSVRPRFDPRQVMALNDVAAANDPDAKHGSEHNGACACPTDPDFFLGTIKRRIEGHSCVGL